MEEKKLEKEKNTKSKKKILLGICITFFVLLLSIGISSAAETNGNGFVFKTSTVHANALSAQSSTKITGVYFGKYSNLVISKPDYIKNPTTTISSNEKCVVLINFANVNAAKTIKFDLYNSKNVKLLTVSYTFLNPKAYGHTY